MQSTAALPLAKEYRFRTFGAPFISEGDPVEAGQPLGAETLLLEDPADAPTVHSSVTGTVRRIHSKGAGIFQLDICPASSCAEATELRQAWRLPSLSTNKLSAAQLQRRCQEAGLVGLGGGGFPTGRKLRAALEGPQRVRAIIANGVACEAGIDADHAVLPEGLPDILRALTALASICDAPVHIALGERLAVHQKPIAAALTAVPLEATLHQLPAQPAGGAEPVLLEQLFKRPAHSTSKPAHDGYLTYNLVSLQALGRALSGEPLLQRPLTLPDGNYWVRLGHPFAALPVAAPRRIGGALSGSLAPADGFVTKTTLALHPATPDTSVAPPAPTPCISCGACRDACPIALDPERLHRQLRRPATEPARLAALETAELQRCFECGHCNPVCPSDIDLLAQLRAGRRELAAEARAKQASELALKRFADHEARAARQVAATEQRRQARLARRDGRRWRDAP